MKSGLSEKYVEILESLGWDWDVDDDEVKVKQVSPAGRNFGFYVMLENFAAEVMDFYGNFDPDDYAENWIYVKKSNTDNDYSIPRASVLIKDAYDIKEMLWELAAALDKADRQTTDSRKEN